MSCGSAMQWLLSSVLAIGVTCQVPSICEAQSPGRNMQRDGQKQGGRRGQQRQRGRRPGRQADDGASLVKGELAPDFKLKSLDGKSETKLSQFRGKKPVILFFGSYT